MDLKKYLLCITFFIFWMSNIYTTEDESLILFSILPKRLNIQLSSIKDKDTLALYLYMYILNLEFNDITEKIQNVNNTAQIVSALLAQKMK